MMNDRYESIELMHSRGDMKCTSEYGMTSIISVMSIFSNYHNMQCPPGKEQFCTNFP